MKLMKKTLEEPHPGEVKYVVIDWLHGFDPILIRQIVLCTAIMLSVNRRFHCTVQYKQVIFV